MAPLVGFECLFMPLGYAGRSRLIKGLHYLLHFGKTISTLRARKPAVVWLQLPQVPLLWAVLLYRLLFARRTKVVADCHNAMFRPPWSKVPLGISLLASCDLVLVHNVDMLQAALALGVPASRTLVLEDVPPIPGVVPGDAPPSLFASKPRPWILFPGSFSADEPVSELLAAAKVLDRGTLVMTGKLSNAARNHHDLSNVPPNVIMPGYLPLQEFDALLRHADLVLALTRFDGIQLSVCNEALGYAKPMVVSDTPLLRSLFASAAVMADSDNPVALAEGITVASSQLPELAARARSLADKRRGEWLAEHLSACLARLRAV